MQKVTFCICFCLWGIISWSQQITYSEGEPEDLRNTYTEIIGKVNGNLLVYKHSSNDYAISVYGPDMSLTERVPLSFLDGKEARVHFIAFPGFVRMIYAYRKINTLYCMQVKLDKDANELGDPELLDTTRIQVSDEERVYSVVQSEDTSKILLFKIRNKKFEEQHYITTMLYDNNMTLLHKSRLLMWYNNKATSLHNFSVTDKGDMVFTEERTADQETYPGSYLLDAELHIKHPFADTLISHDLNLSGKLLTGPVLRVDNLYNHYVINSFYSAKTDIEGLYTAVWNAGTGNWNFVKFTELGGAIKKLAKPGSSNVSNALNNFYINEVILKKDGGFVLSAEDIDTRYTSLTDGYPHRSPSSSLYDTYQSYYRRYSFRSDLERKPEYSLSSGMSTYNNILVLDADSAGNLNWGNVIAKSQYQMKFKDYPFSFATLVDQGQLDFIFNQPLKETWLLASEHVTSDGEVVKNPPLTGIQEGYIFMPAFGRQTGLSEMTIPCIYRDHYCFAKIEIP